MAQKSSGGMLDESSLVAFDHVAAGHEGVKCSSDGSLVIKPCTQQEVDFYESSANHPALRAFMPTYMGTLTQGSPSTASALDPSELRLPPTSINTAMATDVAVQGSIDTRNLPSASSSTATTTLSPTFSHTSELTRNTSLSPSSPYISAHVAQWVPKPNPLTHYGRPLDTDLSIVLENVASGFVHPNVLDIKLGSRLWADDAPPAKRQKLDDDSKNSTSSTLGFRIAGMKVWKGIKSSDQEGSESALPPQGDWEDKDGYRSYNKLYGRKLTPVNVKMGFEEFLSGQSDAESKRALAVRLAHEMRAVQLVLENEESRMYSASILIVYEGDEQAFAEALAQEKLRQEKASPAEGEEDDELVDIQDLANGQIDINTVADVEDTEDDDEEEENIRKVSDLRLIDFAHAEWTPGQGPDENVLQGIRRLVSIWEDLASSSF